MFLWNRDVTHYLIDQAYIHTTAFTANLFLAFLQVKEKSGPPLESACSMASNGMGVGSNPGGGNPTQQSYSSQSATSFLSSSDHQAFNSQTTASFANSSIVTSSATATGSIFRSKIGHCNGTLLSPLGM